MHLAARAWGYAGASLLLAAKIELTPNGTLWGKPELKTDQEAERKPGPRAVSHSSEHESAPIVSGRAANLHVRDGAQASFNLFAGVQAGIELTGALNWAPPTGLAAVHAIPGQGVGSLETSDANQWMTMGELTGGVGVAAGVGAKANAKLSMQNGRLILVFKASAVAGLGVNGEYSFALSYQGIVELLQIYRRELHRNHGIPLVWVDVEVVTYFNHLNILASAGLSVSMLSLMRIDTVMSLYEALTRPGRAGPLALSIKTYEKQSELAEWFVEATPAALGPMLLTLISTPREFTPEFDADSATSARSQEERMANGVQTGQSISRLMCNLFQQEAIEQILRWIVAEAKKSPDGMENARHQFGQACLRMNQFGVDELNSTQAYRQNRRKLDAFMATPVMSGDVKNNFMREEYIKHVQQLASVYDALYGYQRPAERLLNRERFWDEGFRAL